MSPELVGIAESIDTMRSAVKKSCGNCEHTKRIDLQVVECFGVPPTPCITGAQQGALGRMNLTVELMRPRMAVNEKPCALWALNPVSPMLNLPNMAKA